MLSTKLLKINKFTQSFFHFCVFTNKAQNQLIHLSLSNTSNLIREESQLNKMKNRSLLLKQSYFMAKKKDDKKEKKEKQKSKIKQTLGDVEEIDLTRFQEPYIKIVEDYKVFLGKCRAGKLDANSFQQVDIKVGKQKMKVSYLAQIAPKTPVSVLINPYDSDNLDAIQKGIIASDDTLQIQKVQKALLVSLPNRSINELKQKMIEKVRKSLNDKKQMLKKERHKNQQALKKYKKVTQEDQLRQIEKQSKQIFDKYMTELDKITKDKQKQLSK